MLSVLAMVTTPVPAAAAEDVPVTANAPLRIMPLGDSITYGGGSELTSGYRVDLYRRLVAAGLDVDFVGSVRSGPVAAAADLDNEGHSGWRIQNIAAQVDGWLATHQPDVVLLHIGTNDIRSDARFVGAVGRLSALIDQIAAARPQAHIFVAKIIGARDADGRGAEQRRINAYNAAVPGIVARKGARVHLVDHSMIDESDLYDMLHPNDHGYAKMAIQWYRALQPVLNRTGVPWPAGPSPFAATSKFLRVRSADGRVLEGRWWYRRTVTVAADGVRRHVPVWQTLRAVPEAYRVRVPARKVKTVRTVPVKGRWTRVDGRRAWVPAHTKKRTVVVTVPAHYENRIRTVHRWVSR